MQDNSETTLGGGYRDDFGSRVKKTRDIDCYRCSPGIGKGASQPRSLVVVGTIALRGTATRARQKVRYGAVV
jgi:hypothetical protein